MRAIKIHLNSNYSELLKVLNRTRYKIGKDYKINIGIGFGINKYNKMNYMYIHNRNMVQDRNIREILLEHII